MGYRVTVFAGLRDHFEQSFLIENDHPISISDFCEALIEKKPNAASILKACRFAVNETFVNGNYQLNDNEHVYIIPPSSGG